MAEGIDYRTNKDIQHYYDTDYSSSDTRKANRSNVHKCIAKLHNKWIENCGQGLFHGLYIGGGGFESHQLFYMHESYKFCKSTPQYCFYKSCKHESRTSLDLGQNPRGANSNQAPLPLK